MISRLSDPDAAVEQELFNVVMRFVLVSLAMNNCHFILPNMFSGFCLVSYRKRGSVRV